MSGKKKTKPTVTRNGRDTHLYLEHDLWNELAEMAEREHRSVTAMVWVLIKEALKARERSA